MRRTIDRFDGPHFFLSNFFPCRVFHEAVAYPSSEHAFQAAKAVNPDDKIRIKNCRTCREAKELGQTIQLRADWEKVKLDIMYSIVTKKFRDNPKLMGKLLATGNSILEEGNRHGDTFWGKVRDVGQNHLGRILMRVRDEAMAKVEARVAATAKR